MSNTLALLAIVLVTFFHALALTQGTLDFAVPDTQLSTFYDEVGTSFLHGRFDVPRESIGIEGFVVDGKTYGYFGPAPALVRIPLNVLFPSMRGRWSRVTMTAACFFTLLACLHLLRNLAAMMSPDTVKHWRESPFEVPALMVCVGLGTTLFFIARRPILYHEAMAFGVAFALWSFVGALAYLRTGRLRWLLTMVLCAGFAYLSRGSLGLGAFLTAGLTLALSCVRLRLVRHVVIGSAVMVLVLGCIAYRNHRMFGSVTGNPPIRYHLAMQVDPQRIARIHGSYVQPQNLGTNLWAYLRPDGVVLRDEFPWLAPQPPEALYQTRGTRIIWVEPFVSLPATSPLWCLLAAVGTWVVCRPGVRGVRGVRGVVRIVLLGTLAAGAPVLVWASISHRFLHDWFPFLMVAGMMGYVQLRALSTHARWGPYLGGVLVVLGLYSCYACVSTAVMQPLAMGIGEVPPDVH